MYTYCNQYLSTKVVAHFLTKVCTSFGGPYKGMRLYKSPLSIQDRSATYLYFLHYSSRKKESKQALKAVSRGACCLPF